MKSYTVDSLTNDNLLSQYRVALRTKDSLERFSAEDELVLDLSNADWFTPSFLVPMSVVIRRLRNQGVDITIRWPSLGVKSYLDQIGFPEGSIRPTKQYENHLPLCQLNTNADESANEIVGDKIDELIKQKFEDLPGSVISGITYPVKEIVANVDEHSCCDFGAILVQSYPNKDFLDICIADDGVSIPGNYQDYGIDFSDDSAALTKALVDGVSTMPDEGHSRGFGLRTTSDLICRGLEGEVLLSSRSSTLYRNRNTPPRNQLNSFNWNGTVFVGRLHLPETQFEWWKYVE